MPLPDSAGEYWLGQQRIAAATLAVAKRLWLRMGRSDFDGSWARMAPTLVATVEQAQLASAGLAADFVPAVLDEQGIDIDPVADLAVDAFVGVTGGGADLASAMQASVLQTKLAVAEGRSIPDALATGGDYLQMLIQTVLSDTGRAAESVGIAARPGTGYVRILNPPSCSRCVILAGRFYKWNAGFRRHPRCDCRHLASTQQVAAQYSVDPDAYFASLSEAQQDKTFGRVKAQAIRDGADMAQVVNSAKGMQVAQVYGRELAYTTEGTTKRGVAGKLIRARGRDPVTTPRLMPEAIYEIAESREDALRLLKLNGYVLDRSGPSAGAGSRTSLVPDIDELLNVPLYQLPTVDLDRVIASGRIMASPAVRPNPPVQMPTNLSDATPQQVFDTAAGLAAHMRTQTTPGYRDRFTNRAEPLDPVAYDLPEIGSAVLESGLNIQSLENEFLTPQDRPQQIAILDMLFGQNRTYEVNGSKFTGVTRPYTAKSIESGDRSDALRVAVALKHLDRMDIDFTDRHGINLLKGDATARTLIDDILADGLNVEHLIDRDILPDVDVAIRSRLDELIAAAKVKDAAVLLARETAEAAAAKAKWAENVAATGVPFKGYVTNYRGTDLDSVSVAKLHGINYEVHNLLLSDRRSAGAAATVADYDMRAISNEVIEKRLNLRHSGDLDVFEEAEMERSLREIVDKHRRVNVADRGPVLQQVLLPQQKLKDIRGGDFVDQYSDMLRAADELGFEADDLESWEELFGGLVKARLNTRLISDPAAPPHLKAEATEKFWRVIDDDFDAVTVAPSPAGGQGLTVARPSAGFSANEPVVPEIDDRIIFMQRLQFENDFLTVPFAARQLLADTGVRVVASRRVSEGPFASMFDGVSSGDGRAVDDLSFYQDQIKAVVISTDSPHGSINVVAHEIGHALDYNILRDNPIEVRWQEQGNPNLPPSIVARAQEPTDYLIDRFIDDPYIRWAHKQYVENASSVDAYFRTGSQGTSVSGREEWIAEGYASLVAGNSAQLSAISGGSREAMDILAWTFRRMGVLP